MASQWVFIVVYYVMTQSGKFWIHLRTSLPRRWFEIMVLVLQWSKTMRTVHRSTTEDGRLLGEYKSISSTLFNFFSTCCYSLSQVQIFTSALRSQAPSMLQSSLRGREVPIHTEQMRLVLRAIRTCIQKFQDWPPGARTANGTTLCQ